ncbi:Uncharacterised protein [Sphingobacterium daejeonense]|nr:Uncharacterised protein [Sphingobacterium daejeonense]
MYANFSCGIKKVKIAPIGLILLFAKHSGYYYENNQV